VGKTAERPLAELERLGEQSADAAAVGLEPYPSGL
jgi:hypothetical protein